MAGGMAYFPVPLMNSSCPRRRASRFKDADHPIVLVDPVERELWKVGLGATHDGERGLIIWPDQ